MDVDAPELDSPELATQLPQLAEFRFQLRAFLSFSEQRATALGITAQQYQMLQVLASAGPLGCSITHLASRLLLRHNSAVELVDRAEDSSLVQRTQDSSDLRRSVLRVTVRGQQLLVQLVREHFEYLQKHGVGLVRALQPILAAPAEGAHQDA